MPDTIVRTTQDRIKRVSVHRLDGSEICHHWQVGSVSFFPRQLRAFLLVAVAALLLGGGLFAKTVIGGTRTGGGTPILCRLFCR